MGVTTAFVKDAKRCYCPLYMSNEDYSFYINFDKPISDPDFEFFKLGLYNGDTRIVSDIAPLQKDLVNSPLYNIFAEFTMPEVTKGFYTFVIYNGTSDEIKCRSNLVAVNRADYLQITSLLQYRHPYNLYNFGYGRLPDFKNIVRIALVRTELQYEVERKQYRNVTDRRFRNVKNYRDKVVKVESHWFDDSAHEAITATYEHDDIMINEGIYTPKSGYNIDPRAQSLLSKGNIELYEQGVTAAKTGVEIIQALDFQITQFK